MSKNLTRASQRLDLRKRRFADLHCIDIVPSWGSTEAQVPRDYRFSICLTETDDTFFTNGLKVVEVLLEIFLMLFALSGKSGKLPDWKIEAVKI